MKKDGTSYVKEVETVNDNVVEAYFAVFEFLKGEISTHGITPYAAMKSSRIPQGCLPGIIMPYRV